MAKKYLNKINVTYRFKLEILKQYNLKDISQEDREELWGDYLKALASVREISRHQARTWKYPLVLK